MRAPEGGGTVTLTNADNPSQTFNLTAAETVVLPTTGISQGDVWTMINPNPFQLPIQASDASLIVNSWGSEVSLVALINTPVTNTDWKVVEHTVLFGRSWQTYSLPISAGTGTISTYGRWVRTAIDEVEVYFEIMFDGVNTNVGRFGDRLSHIFYLCDWRFPQGSSSAVGNVWVFANTRKYLGVVVPAFDTLNNAFDAFQLDTSYGAGVVGGPQIETATGNPCS